MWRSHVDGLLMLMDCLGRLSSARCLHACCLPSSRPPAPHPTPPLSTADPTSFFAQTRLHDRITTNNQHHDTHAPISLALCSHATPLPGTSLAWRRRTCYPRWRLPTAQTLFVSQCTASFRALPSGARCWPSSTTTCRSSVRTPPRNAWSSRTVVAVGAGTGTVGRLDELLWLSSAPPPLRLWRRCATRRASCTALHRTCRTFLSGRQGPGRRTQRLRR